MKNVFIYTTPTCVYCKMTKEFFQKNDILYTEYNVASNEQKRNEMLEKSNQMGVPVIDIDGEIVVGFNEGRLKTLLGV